MLYGRDAERSAIAAVLDRARDSQSAVLVIRGEAGVGKSAVLADAVEQAQGMAVVHVVAVESESELAFAGLHQVVWPLLTYLDEIPPPQASALRAALGLEPASANDRFLTAAALLSVLAAAAEERPLLCVVDDAHWLDAPSADALTFAARRLHAEPIAMLFGAREGEERRFEAADLAELVLSGLETEAAKSLLAEHASPSRSPAPQVRDWIIEKARGNPLALIELPHALTVEQLSGNAPVGETIPLTEAIESAFLHRVRHLSEPTQTLLLLAAADDTADAAIVIEAARALGVDWQAFEEAESARLLRLDEGAVEFRHPLVRSAVYGAASFSQRQAVHQALADVLVGDRYADRRVWHRAAISLGMDAEVAAELERAADRAKARSGYGAAVAALERAAALTPDDEPRARRLAAAAQAAWLAGQPTRALALLERTRRLTSDPLLRADADHLRGLIELQSGVPAMGHSILLEAAVHVAAIDPDRAATMLVSAGEAAAFAGDLEGETEAGRQAERLHAEHSCSRFEVTMMMGVRRVLDGEWASGSELLREVAAAAEASDNPRGLFWAGSANLYLLDLASARRFFARAADRARDDGAVAMLALALQMLAQAELMEGRFSSAAERAAEGLKLALETGQENGACQFRAILAWTSAASGNEEACRQAAGAVHELARARGLGIQAAFATIALGELEVGLGRPEQALAHFEALRAAGPGSSHEAFKLLVVPSLIEVEVQLGRLDEARAALQPYEAWITTTASPWELAKLARARGLLAAVPEARRHFEEALALHSELAVPFERARTEFAYGGMLRRAKQRSESRDHLRTAAEIFEQLGAASWAERARAELRATGETRQRRDASSLLQLTPQELQIARLVAGGQSNKEVAAHLFLSPRTIDSHLRNVFSKLGITSRMQLHGLLPEPAPDAAMAPAQP